MKCLRGCGNEARIHAMYGILPCLSCISEDNKERKSTIAPEFVTQSQQTRVQGQRDRYEGDMIPPFNHNGKPNEEFARAFPEKAKELFSDYERVTNANLK